MRRLPAHCLPLPFSLCSHRASAVSRRLEGNPPSQSHPNATEGGLPRSLTSAPVPSAIAHVTLRASRAPVRPTAVNHRPSREMRSRRQDEQDPRSLDPRPGRHSSGQVLAIPESSPCSPSVIAPRATARPARSARPPFVLQDQSQRPWLCHTSGSLHLGGNGDVSDPGSGACS